MSKDTIRVLVLNGCLYDWEKTKHTAGPTIEAVVADINTEINAKPGNMMVNMNDLFDIVVAKAPEGTAQTLPDGSNHVVESHEDDPVVILLQGKKMLLLMGHKKLIANKTSKGKIAARLLSTVAFKKSRFPTAAELTPPKPAPAPSYPPAFNNAPRPFVGNRTNNFERDKVPAPGVPRAFSPPRPATEASRTTYPRSSGSRLLPK